MAEQLKNEPEAALRDPGAGRKAGAASFWRKHRWLLWTSGGALVVLLALSAVLDVLAHRFEPYLHAQIVHGLEQKFHTRVELDHFHIAVHHGKQAQWGLWATGDGLRIWPPNTGGNQAAGAATQSTPLIQLGEFSFHVPLRYESTQSLRIAEVRLKGLQIRIPPRSERDRQAELASAMAAQSSPDGEGGPQKSSRAAGVLSSVVVARVESEHAQLVIETDKPNKLPMTFDIIHLTLRDVNAGAPMAFEATLTNPKPAGLIQTTGSFGPWSIGDPGESPVSGHYRFEHADLSTIKGIAGILTSTGDYQGNLRNIHTNGTADVPDFQLEHFGSPVPLHTRFHARVDGTDGDTWLDGVDATLGHSQFTTQGKIVRMKLSPASDPSGSGRQAGPDAGHLIDLKVDVERAHIDDFLRLTSRAAQPILTGYVATKAALHISPGKDPVYMRLKLDGFFKLEDARFTSDKIQDKVEDLSLRGQGHPEELKSANKQSVSSQMQGSFHVASGVITLPDLEYTIPGATVQLHGTYALDGKLDFEGAARMQATVSQMVGGWKGFLLKPADRIFKKDGTGAEFPIQIKGTRDDPKFGLDFGRLKKTSPQTPGRQDP